MTNEKPDKTTPGTPAPGKDGGSGNGADSALQAMIKKRQPRAGNTEPAEQTREQQPQPSGNKAG